MNKLSKNIAYIGKTFLSISILGFGLIQLLTGKFPTAFISKTQVGLMLITSMVYVSGIVLVIIGFCLLINKFSFNAALIGSLFFLILLLFPHLFHFYENIKNPTKWTVLFELIAIWSGLIMLANSHKAVSIKYIHIVSKVAYYAFALSLLVFGVLHILYRDFIITLMPSWMPLNVLWSYLIPVGFIGAALSLVLNKQRNTAMLLLGCMFFLWVVILHLPRAIDKSNIEAEWTSLFVAFAMSGICFLMEKKK